MASNPLIEKLDLIQTRFDEVAQLITQSDVMSDMKRYAKLGKEYKELDIIVKAGKEYRQLIANIEEAKEILENESDADMREMAKEELAASQERQPQLEEEIKILLVPADPQDSKNAIVEIRGGTGGDEAAIFAGDLFRMYSKFCEMKGWKTEVTSSNPGTSGGYKEIIFTVSGENVYGILKYESGVHRVQRVPQTETQGRVHTSASTVAVLPEAEEFDIELKES
ncbi:MAG: PCRF domain-containing protein, partial [Bacteroidales bacterium]|nr:PCRF domain-containing protein [Bacteroidales bacterium]